LLSEKGATYVFNHVHLLISYHKGSEQNKFTDGRIVRAQVQLASCKKFPCTAKSEPLKLPKPSEIDEKEGFNLTYSYTVEFIVSAHNIIPI
ncbi:MAG: transmembrane 9 family protein, partial [Proteobacteria bacterium]|nr:transmembrane 9 family protein [Pseudomonadota bacterium]